MINGARKGRLLDDDNNEELLCSHRTHDERKVEDYRMFPLLRNLASSMPSVLVVQLRNIVNVVRLLGDENTLSKVTNMFSNVGHPSKPLSTMHGQS